MRSQKLIKLYKCEDIFRKKKLKKYHKCLDCGKELKSWRPSVKRKRCWKCYCIYIKNPKHHPNYKDGRTLKKYSCIFCGTEINFNTYLYGSKKCRRCVRIKHGKSTYQHYCKCGNKIAYQTALYGKGMCRKCYGKWRSKIMKRKLSNPKNHWNYKNGKYTKEYFCIDCGKKISDEAGIKGNGRCVLCHIKNLTLTQTGKLSSRWLGGITDLHLWIRSLDKNDKWKTLILKRDNYICQKCRQRGGRLEVHHIKPFAIVFKEFLNKYNQFSPSKDKEILVRLAEKYKPFWSLKNGITLCIKCHKDIRRRKSNDKINSIA